MGRLIELLLVIVLALTIWRLARDLLAPRGGGRDPGPGRTFEATGRCAQCGTHVPRGHLDASGRCPQCR